MNSYSLKKGFSWLNVIVASAIGCTLLVLFIAYLEGNRRYYNGDRTKALANAKSIVGGLLAFKSNKGSYPCQATRELLEAEGIDSLPSGTSANAYFAQLVATDNIDNEWVFFAPGFIGGREGDNIMGSSDKLLEAGENCFAYIMAPNEKPLTDTRGNTPLVLAPVKEKGTSEPIFDGGPYGDKFVMSLVDGSARSGKIDENGHALSLDDCSLFQSGADSIFGKDSPVVKYPLFPKR